jgi:NitT/TauT family transport system substrate-binding protein
MQMMRIKTAGPARHASRAWLAVAVASMLGLTACGGGSSAGSASADDDGKLVMRSTGPTFTDLPTTVILAQDYFSEVGLDVDFEFLTASNAATATQGLIAGEMDIASGGAGSLYSAYAAGMKDLVSIGSVNPGMTFGVAVNNEAAEQMAEAGVTPDSPIEERVQALKGMSIASSPEGSTGQKYLKIILGQNGLDPNSDVKIVPNADNAAQVAAARQGRVDGFANSFPNTNLPSADGWGVLWLNHATDLPQILPLAAHEVYTSREWLEDNPEDAEKLMRAYWLAMQDLQNPTDELKEKIRALDGFKDLNPDAFDEGWELSVPVYQDATPVPTEEMFQNQVDLVNFENDTPIDFSFDDIYDVGAAEAAQP